MNSDNSKKVRSGNNNQQELSSLLNEFQDKYKNVEIINKNQRYGEKGKNQNQFFVNAEIRFSDNYPEIWILKTTSSYRSDRSKGDEFDVEHIKKILSTQKKNSKAFFIVPDNQKEKDMRAFNNFRKNVENKKVVSYFDHVITISEFKHFLNERCNKYISQGIRANILGNDAEKNIVEAFNNKKNIILLNTPDNTIEKSKNFAVVYTFMNSLYPHQKLKSMEAFHNIKKLKDEHYLDELNIVRDNGQGNLGKPKTDVLIKLVFEDNHIENIKLSVKRPQKSAGKNIKRVTVHEGNVQTLLADLKKSLPEKSIFNNPEQWENLKSSLINFQHYGSVTNMDDGKRDFLNKNLSKLNNWLIDYFLFGINNSRFNDNQMANAMAIVNPDNGDLLFLTAMEEKNLLLQYCKKQKSGSTTFGTPFNWTYPSHKKGKKIQIKSPILFNQN